MTKRRRPRDGPSKLFRCHSNSARTEGGRHANYRLRLAVARKLGIRFYIMLRDQIDYEEFCRRGQMRQKNGAARAGIPEVGYGPSL